jgi:hypothetical protein
MDDLLKVGEDCAILWSEIASFHRHISSDGYKSPFQTVIVIVGKQGQKYLFNLNDHDMTLDSFEHKWFHERNKQNGI